MIHKASRIQRLVEPPSTELIDRLEALMKAVVYKVNDQKRPEDAAPELEEIKRLSGVEHSAELYFEIWSWTEVRQLAEQTAYYAPDAITDLSQEELLEAIKICVEPGPKSEFMIRFLEQCFPQVFNSDLLFYPHRDMTEAELVEEIFRRKQLLDQDGRGALDAYLAGLAESIMADPAAKYYSQQWAQSVLKA